MDDKSPFIILKVSDPGAFSAKGSIIVLEYVDETAAMSAARKIASERHRPVTITGGNGRLIGAILDGTLCEAGQRLIRLLFGQ